MAEYIIQEETLRGMADILREKRGHYDDIRMYITDRDRFHIAYIPEEVGSIRAYAFRGCIGLHEITFKGTPNTIANDVFYECTNLTTINVPWAEGAVANAPWGASKVTINYNCVEEE